MVSFADFIALGLPTIIFLTSDKNKNIGVDLEF